MHYDHITPPGFAAKELTFDLARLREAIRKPKGGAQKESVEEELQRLVPSAKLLGTSGFGDAVIRHMHE